MTRKIFNSIIIVAGTILLSSVIIIMGCLYNYFEDVRERGLTVTVLPGLQLMELSYMIQLQTVRNTKIIWNARKLRVHWKMERGKVTVTLIRCLKRQCIMQSG